MFGWDGYIVWSVGCFSSFDFSFLFGAYVNLCFFGAILGLDWMYW